ncbi:uncharacterized protein LOC133532533 [Cydia pomonella]|uniref:uncharacterized protein LOC133532533 n=1 Tax=Cydia pomonella TaxID=82600 RepID=UPI002ADE1ACF|nr:uncharacterized protein LOC133532533 [Cydia pomonella]
MGAHACEICLVRFKRQSRRQEHQDLHRLKFLCKECSFVSRNRYQAKKHFEWHSGKIHVCKHLRGQLHQKLNILVARASAASCDECGMRRVRRDFCGATGTVATQVKGTPGGVPLRAVRRAVRRRGGAGAARALRPTCQAVSSVRRDVVHTRRITSARRRTTQHGPVQMRTV